MNSQCGLKASEPGIDFLLPLVLAPDQSGESLRNGLQPLIVWHRYSLQGSLRTKLEVKNMAENDFPLPPPTFEFLVFSLKTQAEVRMGLLKFSEEEEQPDLNAARHAIDLLAMIHEKTRNNLSMDEQRLIENSLTELRFRFVQVSETVGKSKVAESTGAETAS